MAEVAEWEVHVTHPGEAPTPCCIEHSASRTCTNKNAKNPPDQVQCSAAPNANAYRRNLPTSTNRYPKNTAATVRSKDDIYHIFNDLWEISQVWILCIIRTPGVFNQATLTHHCS